jgi:dipeptidyl aminopeptidase/acylaminoacyl peptidase
MSGAQASSQDEYQLSLNEIYPREAIYGFQLSPDGRLLSFVHQVSKRAEEILVNGRRKIKESLQADLCLIPCEGGYPRRLTNSGDYCCPGVWSPDGVWLATEGPDGLQIIPSNGGKPRTICKAKVHHPGGSWGGGSHGADFCYLKWSPDGRFILFATRDPPKTTLDMVSTDGSLLRELFSVDGYISEWDLSPDGQKILLVARNEDGWVGDIRLLSVETGDAQVLWNEENYEYQRPIAAWSPGGEDIVLRSNRSGWSKLWFAKTTSRQLEQLTVGDWDDYFFRFSPEGSRLVYSSKAEQNGTGDDLWLISIPRGEKSDRLTKQPGVNVPLGWSKDDWIYYWHSSPVEPGDLWRVSANDKVTQRLTWSAAVGLEKKLRAPEEVHITNKDGTQIPSLIYKPAYSSEKKKYPAIVWIHGGPVYMSRYDFNPLYNWLANKGYVVVVPNYRGSLGNGISFMTPVAGEGVGKNDLADVVAAAKYARNLPYVDLTRGIGVGGTSWGGYLTLMAVTQAPDEFSCGVAGAAITDWTIQQAQTEVRYYDHWLIGGWVYEQSERARERSPIHFVDRIKAKLLTLHGEEDRDVPFIESKYFAEKAQRSGVDIEYVTYPVERHANRKPENQQNELDRIEAFFRKHLQPWNFRDNPSGDQLLVT